MIIKFKAAYFIIPVIITFLACNRADLETLYSFDEVPDRVWVGEDFWTVPLEGWHVSKGRVECLSHLRHATLSNLTHVLEESNAPFTVRFDMGLIEKGDYDGSSGIIIGSEAPEEKDVRAAVYFGQGINLGVNTAGYAFLASQLQQLPDDFDYSEFTLEVRGSGTIQGYEVEMIILDAAGNIAADLSVIPEGPVTGIVQLVNNFRGPGSNESGPRFWFDNIYFNGPGFSRKEENRFGPVLWTMHSLSRNTMKMTAQLPPISESENRVAELQVRNRRKWETVADGEMDADSRTVSWKVENWHSGNDQEYRVVFDYISSMGETRKAEYGGTIRRDPVDRPLRFGSLTCQFWRGFPYTPVVRNLELSEPDILYFSGDQIYESNGGYPHVRWPDETAILNYLGKWYMFGWAFGDLMRDIPAIVTPDDHDVYHGNLWGDGGVPFNNQRELLEADVRGGTSDQRGFIQTARFVDMMQRTQVAHLPDPWDPTPIEQGLSVWYTDLVYGRVSFGIVSDRIFKSPPELVSIWEGRHDHLLMPLDDPSALDKPGLEMFGERQERFMESWIRDWENAEMKVLLTQTPITATATHHGNFNDYLHGDLDSGGWPKTPRDRALRIIRRGFAFNVNGDQHLASIVHYGIDDFRDAGYGFSPPAIASTYSRWFRPMDVEQISIKNPPQHGLPNTGEYIDAFGNLNYMYAVGNPDDFDRGEPDRWKLEHSRAAGFGMVIFDNEERTIKIECWRFLADVGDPKAGDQFPGWPLTISQFDNYGREAAAWLPALKIQGEPDPVVEIINEVTGELEYSVRIKGLEFEPWVFSNDLFTIRVGYPEAGEWQESVNVKPIKDNNTEELNFIF
jgi:alkaline phosphatase D